MRESDSTLRSGVVAGVLGAATVALWFLIMDLIAGRPLYTPAALGSALFLRAERAADVDMSAGIILGYTIFHIAAFIALGVLAAALVRRAEREPSLLLGGVLLFVTMEAFVIGVIAILAAWLLDRISWWAIALANLFAVIVMGWYFWRASPALREGLRSESLEEDSSEKRRPAA